MPLQPSQRLAQYEILGSIGAGGMGEVYRARDTKLGREVAVKVLPEDFARDPERLSRFEREARLLASLNHPNIATLHGLEEDDGLHFLVMELVEGETLEERLSRGPLELDEALTIFRQIALALEAAHRDGVIHRDLKPANVKITPEGTVKVLDFGLAKAFEPETPEGDLSQSPTAAYSGTMAGVIMGTAPYMSPEQARGKKVDSRTDVWSYGCVLYEALSGTKPFAGETVTDTLAAVVRSEPDWSILPSATPPSIQRLAHRCLTKDLTSRLQHVGDARLEIEDAGKTELLPVSPAAPRTAPLALAGGLLVAITAALVWSVTRPEPAAPARLIIAPPASAPLSLDTGAPDIAISPDGSRIVYTSVVDGSPALVVRELNAFDAEPLERIGANPTSPFWSPDGQWIGFFSAGKLMKAPTTGGAAVTICEVPGNFSGASWGDDNAIVFSTAGRLHRVDASGGEPEPLTEPNREGDEISHRWPEVLPGGRGVLFEIDRVGTIEASSIAALSLETGEWKVVAEGGSFPKYASSGHLVYAGSGVLWAQRFDLDTLESVGERVPLQHSVLTKSSNAASFGIAPSGTLAYVPGDPRGSSFELVWVDRGGMEEPTGLEPRVYANLSLSPDGTKVAVSVLQDNEDIWVMDLDSRASTRLTFDPGRDQSPTFDAGGRFVYFRSDLGGIFRKAADGSGDVEMAVPSGFAFAESVSPDGRTLALSMRGEQDVDIFVHDLVDGGDPQLIIEGPGTQNQASFSPNGAFLAYISTESGRAEVYVVPYPNVNGGKWQISTRGGFYPMWSPDGTELFFRSQRSMMVASVGLEPGFTHGEPRALFDDPYYRPGRTYGVAPDGQRFLMVQEVPGDNPDLQALPHIRVVLNWLDELKALVP